MFQPVRRCAEVFALLALIFVPVSAFSQPAPRKERIIIKTPKPYGAVVARINALGGKVKHQYEYIDAIAADVPAQAMPAVRSLVGLHAISKDNDIPLPRTVLSPRPTNLKARVAQRAAAGSRPSAQIFPSRLPDSGAYLLNLAGVNLRDLHASGKTGKGVVVAVIDSGIRPGYPALDLDGSLAGCENFVDDDEDGILEGQCSDPENEPHGTFVAGMISANAELNIAGSPVLPAIREHLPPALKGQNVLPLIGSAPLSKIYALRVFGANPLAGAPQSRIIAAIERVIRLRKRADAGRPDGVDIQICNLSFGSATLEAGRDPLDQAVDALLKNGIVPVISIGNVGPSSLTAASPASSYSSLSVAAGSRTANERIYWDSFYGVESGVGLLQRPLDGTTQTATFSSRGPHADGRIDPDVTASGYGNVGQGYAGANDVSSEAGTSLSAPIVAGVAAVLRQAFPRADAIEIFNAIVMSANPRKFDDGSTDLDQGKGWVDAQAAFDLLKNGRAPNRLPESFSPSRSVRDNIERGTDLTVLDGIVRPQDTGKLNPGERYEILYFVRPDTTRVVINIAHFRKTAPDVDAFYPDDFWLNVHSAETSSIGAFGDYLLCDPQADPEFAPCPPYFGVFTRNGEFVIRDPEPGVMRITLTASTTNRGNVSADVSVFSDVDPVPRFTAKGNVKDGQDIVLTVRVPKNVKKAEFRLDWTDDWANYPTSDIDMAVFDPQGTPILDENLRNPGASLNHPERVFVRKPDKGDWFVVITGFDVPNGKDEFRLRVILDGEVLQ